MTDLKFLASIIDSLAWPGLIVFVVWRFHEPLSDLISGPITELINRIKTVKSMGVEASFVAPKTVANATARAADQAATSPEDLGLPPNVSDIIDATPNLAIVRIWAALEKELAKAMERAYHWSDRDCIVNIKFLQSMGDIDPDDGQSLSWMRFTRGHLPSSTLFSSETAFDMPQLLKVAEYLIDKLQKIAPEQDD